MLTATFTSPAAQFFDPFGPLVAAIGSALTDRADEGRASPGMLSAQVARALHQVLEASTPESRSVRLMLIRHLVDVESQTAGMVLPKMNEATNDLLSTAQAAEILGYSRPYIAMLIDQHKLQGATVSAGGHRRVPRAAVLAWQREHQSTSKAVDSRTEGQKIGVYASTEADALRRINALDATSP